MRIAVAGDSALMIHFDEAASGATSARIQRAVAVLRDALGDIAVDLVPAFTTLLVVYRPLLVEPAVLRRQIHALLQDTGEMPLAAGKRVELPVYYSTASGLDMERIARYTGLSTDEIIHCHSSGEYRVMAIGFMPGFAYLGDLDTCLAVPRLESPRLRVPRGAVAIANRQTAVYPQISPGGWNLVGLCPTTLFDPLATPPLRFEVGDRVRFRAVDRDEFLALGGEL